MATRQMTAYSETYPRYCSASASSSWFNNEWIDFTAIPDTATNIQCASVELRYTFSSGGIDTKSGYEWIWDTAGTTRYTYNITATNINNWITANSAWFYANKKIRFHPGFKAKATSTSGYCYFSITMSYQIDAESYIAYSSDGVNWTTCQVKVLDNNAWTDVQLFYCEDGSSWIECNHSS